MTCRMPFVHLELVEDGALSCCGAFYTSEFFKLHADPSPLPFLWNNTWIQQLRSSVLDGSYLHCDDRCPDARKFRGEPASDLERESRQIVMEKGPEFLSLSNDRSCNLCCRSCRSTRYMATNQQADDLYAQTTALLDEIGQTLKVISLSSCGEPFASRYYLRLMREYLTRDRLPITHLHIGTNGQLFDQKMWYSLACQEMIALICVSVDASCRETYQKVRSADWDRLMANIAFMVWLHQKHKIHVQLRMVVQGLNWREMDDFYEWASALGVEPVYQLVYHGVELTIDDIPYHPDHPDREAFLSHLRDFDARHPDVEAYYRHLL
jgi:MoaA/NifB/PqqE/SkfB family radical SAM enzyme